MKKNPKIMGIAVPSPRTSKKSDVFPGKRMCEMEEKKKAESPKPDMTMATAIARWTGIRYAGVEYECDETHKVVRETFSGSVHGTGHSSMSSDTSDKATQDEEHQAHSA
jgi:hypothetical protein